ncbi:hypothetical protein [Streptomyces sp. LN325]|uniref:hypothetical protein n=1 Tax=Streptomyces sp. LN325 TaxID=3112976 RepID=UPI0037182F1C
MVQEPVRADITDAVVEEAYTGPALFRSFAHVLAPPADLPGLEAVSAATSSPTRPSHPSSRSSTT